MDLARGTTKPMSVHGFAPERIGLVRLPPKAITISFYLNPEQVDKQGDQDTRLNRKKNAWSYAKIFLPNCIHGHFF